MAEHDIDPLWDYVEIDPQVVRVDLLLEKVQVRCRRCCSWHRYSDLIRERTTFSPSVGWRCVYRCPDCRAQIGEDDLEVLIIEALESGRDWVRLTD
jgi:hypothetical protein